MPITAKDFEGLQGGVNQITAGRNASQLESLKAFLEPMIAKGKQEAQNKANIETLKDPMLQSVVEGGGAAKAGDISVGADPYAKMAAKQTNGDAAARKYANQIYNQGLPKIQSAFQAASEGLNAINDPDNIGSLGQARTLMLKAMGMSRYNENEAKAVLPPSLQGVVANVFNYAGGDASPLNESQRKNINQFFNQQLDAVKNQHETLKQNALTAYNTSPYYNAAGAQTLQQLGSPLTSSLTDAATKYKDLPKTQGPALSAQPAPTMLDKLKGLFKMGGSAPQTQAPSAGGKVKVKRKSDGATGTMDSSDPALKSGLYDVAE